MATKLIVPRAANEGGLGTTTKPFGPSYIQMLYLKAANATGLIRVSSLTTTDETESTLFTITLTSGQAISIRADIVCATSDGVTAAVMGKCCGARYQTAGATSLIPAGSLTTVSSGQDRKTDALIDAHFNVSTNDVRLRITGLAATTINWSAIITYVLV